jgi:hypothetical protein
VKKTTRRGRRKLVAQLVPSPHGSPQASPSKKHRAASPGPVSCDAALQDDFLAPQTEEVRIPKKHRSRKVCWSSTSSNVG